MDPTPISGYRRGNLILEAKSLGAAANQRSKPSAQGRPDHRDRSVLTFEEFATRFESLGEDCEFGLVQRSFGAEPLGLFRFTRVGMEGLIDVVSTGGTHLFTPDDLLVVYYEPLDEFLYMSSRYQDFTTHTFLGTKQISKEALQPKMVRIAGYVKAKFFEDLKASGKIYVRRGADSIVDLRRLHSALNMHGQNTLLTIAEADRYHRAGTVEKIEEGIWRGYLTRFKNFNRHATTDLVSWTRIMEHVYKATHAEFEPARSRRLAHGRGLKLDPRFVDDHVQTIAAQEVELGVEQDAVIVLSVWVKIGAEFEGSRVGADIDLPMLHNQDADLARRARWQRVWATAKLPAGRRATVLGIKVSSFGGANVSIGRWSVVTGPIQRSGPWASLPGEILDLVRRSIHRSPSVEHEAPHSTAGVASFAVSKIAEQSYIEAEDMIAGALAKSPNDPALLKSYALSANNKGDYNRALMRWMKALEAAPSDPLCHAGVAANFREIGELQHAATRIETALRMFPEDGMVLTEASRIAIGQNRFAEALEFLNTTIRLHGALEYLTTSRELVRAQLDRVDADEADVPRVTDCVS